MSQNLWAWWFLLCVFTTTTSASLGDAATPDYPDAEQLKNWGDFSSNWTWPPPLDSEFLKVYYNYHNGAPTNESDKVVHATDMIIEALQNLTMPGKDQFGGDEVVVRVGDIISPTFMSERVGPPKRRRRKQRRIEMNCLVCKRGKENGTVLNACGNYTDVDETDVASNYNITELVNSGSDLVFPDLSDLIVVPNKTVGLCFLTLPPDDQSYTGIDHTIPFAVAQERRASTSEVWFFNEGNPTGTPIPKIESPEGTPRSSSSSSDLQEPNHYGPNIDHGAIAGIVIGVAAAAGIAVGAFLILRKKNNTLPKSVDTSPNGTELGPVSNARVRRSLPGGVERRMSSDENGDVPPSYQQAIADRQNEVNGQNQPA